MANTYKDTMNLPQTDFPMRGNLPASEPERLRKWEGEHLYEQYPGQEQGRQALRAARRPALCQRPYPHRALLQQDPEGLRGEVPCPARLLHPLRARLGLPWPAHRAHGGEEPGPREDGPDRPAYVAPPVPRVGPDLRGRAARGLQAPGRQRRLGASLPHVLRRTTRPATSRSSRSCIWTGQVYRGRKPIHWCKRCHTALAEAEIEYADETSPSIFVRFKLDVMPGVLRGCGRRGRRLRAHLDHHALDAAGRTRPCPSRPTPTT